MKSISKNKKDINIARRDSFSRKHCQFVGIDGKHIPLFSVFEINVCGLCNRVCSFCPRGNDSVFKNTNEFLSVDLFKKIVKELSQYGYDGIFLFSAFCEPLLHKRLETLIRLTKKYCPKSRAEIVTNGDKLTLQRMRILFASGLDTALVSLYDGPHQKNHFDELRKKRGLKKGQMILRPRYKTSVFILTNRCGTVSKNFSDETVTLPLKRKCFLPSYTLMMDHDGCVYVCTHDWGKKLLLGNVKRQSIIEIWNGEMMKNVRQRLMKTDRAFSPCNKCDAQGILVGREHYILWKRYYKQL